MQIGADVRCSLIPKLSILLERLQHDLFEAFGQVGSNGPQRRRLLMENRGPNDGTASRKRRTAGRHFVQHQPEREEVRSRVDLFAAQLLRRHVGQRADNAARVGQERSGLELRRRRVSRRNARVGFDEAEVENLRSVRGQQDVGGLDIAVDDAGGMSRLKGVGEGGADLEDDPLVQRAVRDSLLQGLTLEQLHDNECLAIGRFSDVVDRADVGVLQGCHCLRFALESLASSSRIGGVRRQQLDGHVSGKSLVTRLVDLAHATRTDGGNDLVRAEAGASSHAR